MTNFVHRAKAWRSGRKKVAGKVSTSRQRQDQGVQVRADGSAQQPSGVEIE